MNIDFIGLELIVFHDLPVKQITLQTDESINLLIDLFEFDDEREEYQIISLNFDKIASISLSELLIKDNSLEINAFDYYLEGNLLFGKFVFITSTNSSEIEFSCESVLINYH